MSEWISVEVELPDDKDGFVPVRFKLTNDDELSGWFWDKDWQWGFRDEIWFIGNRHVTHWMRPPEDK